MVTLQPWHERNGEFLAGAARERPIEPSRVGWSGGSRREALDLVNLVDYGDPVKTATARKTSAAWNMGVGRRGAKPITGATAADFAPEQIDQVVDDFKKRLLTSRKKGQTRFSFEVLTINGNPRLVETGRRPNPGRRARARATHKPGDWAPYEAGRRAVEVLRMAEGGSWSGTELKAQFGLTPATLHRRRAAHRTVFWRDAQGDFHYPQWQFTENGALRPGIKEVLQTFRSADEWRVMDYFLSPRRQLDNQTPLALLRAGEVGRVTEHARAHAEENTW